MKLDFCVACGAFEELHHHHLLPKALKGGDEPKNLITLCIGCHGTLHGVAFSRHHAKLSYEGLIKARDDGKRYTRSLYGSEWVDGVKVDNVKEQKVIKRMLRMKAQGVTYEEITRVLNDDCVPTKTGKGRWFSAVVRRIITRCLKG